MPFCPGNENVKVGSHSAPFSCPVEENHVLIFCFNAAGTDNTQQGSLLLENALLSFDYNLRNIDFDEGQCQYSSWRFFPSNKNAKVPAVFW